MRCDDRRVSGRCGGLAFKCDYKNNTRDDHVQAAFLVGRRSSDSRSGPRLPSAVKKKKKKKHQFRSNGLVVATGWSLFFCFVNNTISSGKSRFVYHKQAVGYAREAGHSPTADGSPARHSPQLGVTFFSPRNQPSHCYIRAQPFPKFMAAAGTLMAAFFNALVRARSSSVSSFSTQGFNSSSIGRTCCSNADVK